MTGSRIPNATASVVVVGCLFGFMPESIAGTKLPSFIPPTSGGNGHTSAEFRVAITILPAPAASKVALESQGIPALNGSVERFSGYTVRTSIADTHITMDVE